MSYDSVEKSTYSGAPVELYRFTQGASAWRYTSADASQTYNGEGYAPEVISRGQIDQSQEEHAGNVEVKLPRDNEVAELFISYLPVIPVSLTVYRFHRSDGQAVTIFIGKVASIAFEGSEATLTCQPVSGVFKRSIPWQLYQEQCNLPLYSAACGIDKASYKVRGTVSGIGSDTITSSAFGTQSDGWFNNGWVQRDNGEVRWIIGHTGNTLTLMNPFDDLVVSENVDAYAGCDRTESVCSSKFNNLVNHLGFARIPTDNPYDSGI